MSTVQAVAGGLLSGIGRLNPHKWPNSALSLELNESYFVLDRVLHFRHLYGIEESLLIYE